MIASETVHITSSDSVNSVYGWLIPYTPTTDALKYICVSINFLDLCLKSLEVDYVWL